MDDDLIVTAFVVIDKVMQVLGHRHDVRAKARDAGMLTVAVAAARYFQNHLARASQVMHLGRYLSGPLSVSRFNRRLHALRGRLGPALEALGAAFVHGAVCVISSMPAPVCRRARAWRRKLEAMGVQRLWAWTNPGFGLKLHASLLAVTIVNAH